MKRDLQILKALITEMQSSDCCTECGGAMYEGMCTECGYMEEDVKTPNPLTDYAGNSAIPGLGPIVGTEGKNKLSAKQKHIARQAPPEDEINAADFKKLRSMKKEGEEGELELGIKYDLNGEIGYIQTGGSNNPRDWKFKGKYEYLAVKDKLVPLEQQPGKYDGAFDMGLGKGHHIDENEDHEVSMANNSIDSILWAANELKKYLGDQERDIPAWIQDHITNAENYIVQAAKNFHEYGDHEEDGEHNEMPNEMSLQEMVKKVGKKYNVYSKKGKKLGSHPSKKKAQKQMAAIEISKQGK